MLFNADGKIELENIDQLVVSQLETEVFNFVWKIKNFPREDVESFPKNVHPTVFTSPTSQTEWEVSLTKGWNRVQRENTPYTCADLRLTETQSTMPLMMECTVWVLDSEMKVHAGPFDFNNMRLVEKVGWSQEFYLWSVDSFVNQPEAYLTDDGSLILAFQLKTITRENREEILHQDEASPVLGHSIKSQESFKSFLDHGHFADVTLSTKTGSFPASKILLAGQSPVFSAMFLSEMIESKENVVKIEDFSDETVKGFLEFLYTGAGESDSLKENAVELLKISEKYEVVPLKRACEKILIKELNKENAADLLILASFYNSPKLKSKIVSFVKTFRKEVSQTDSFKQLKKVHPEILLDLYSEFD